MKQVTYIEFYEGDPEPKLSYVIDSSSDRWEPESDGIWAYGQFVKQRWDNLLEVYGPLRIPIEDAAGVLRQAVIDAEKRLAEARAALAAAAGYRLRYESEDSEPRIEGLTLRDRDGDFWRYNGGTEAWMFSRDGQRFNEGDCNSWGYVMRYGPLEVVNS